MAHAALKELFPARVIPFEQPSTERAVDHLRAAPPSKEASRPSLQDVPLARTLDGSNWAHALEVIAQAALSQHVQAGEVRKLETRVNQVIEQLQSKLRDAEICLQEAERRAQDAEHRAGEAEEWLWRMHDGIMRNFGPVRS